MYQGRQITHNKAEEHGAQRMEYDIDGSGRNTFLEQAVDNQEWGGFEQIVMLSNIYHINIGIHSYGNDIQHSDGDDFIADNTWDYKTGQIFITKPRDEVDPIQR
eukprot:6170535-Heterocapsa_arctica.AAC.1